MIEQTVSIGVRQVNSHKNLIQTEIARAHIQASGIEILCGVYSAMPSMQEQMLKALVGWMYGSGYAVGWTNKSTELAVEQSAVRVELGAISALIFQRIAEQGGEVGGHLMTALMSRLLPSSDGFVQLPSSCNLHGSVLICGSTISNTANVYII